MKETRGYVEKIYDDETPKGSEQGYFIKVWIPDPSFESLHLGKIKIIQDEM